MTYIFTYLTIDNRQRTKTIKADNVWAAFKNFTKADERGRSVPVLKITTGGTK